ncbi:MAG: holo-ACP synthase [Reichenbachiella sp.]
MIQGIGTDIVDTTRFERKLGDKLFLDTIFTQHELDYSFKKNHVQQHLAARFAAKESYMKAIGSGWSKEANFNEIEVQNKKSGAPFIVLYGEGKRYFEKLGLKEIFVSLSHTTTHAVAQVIITK